MDSDLIEKSHKLFFKTVRLQTFNKNWRELKGFKYCTPENFAAAGFYNFSSKKFRDNVKCFACQKELSDWEKDDDPWEEHMKRGRNCPFVLFKSKGETTVQDFAQLYLETEKNVLSSYFEDQKKILEEKETMLLKKLNALEKSKK